MDKVVTGSKILFILLMFAVIIFLARSCVNEKKHLNYSLKEIDYLKSIKIDSILVDKYDGKKAVLKDSVLIQKIVNGYLNLVQYKYGNGRYSSDRVVLEFYSHSKVPFSSIAWVNDYSTLVFIKSKTNNYAPSYGNLLMNKELGEILKTTNKNEK